ALNLLPGHSRLPDSCSFADRPHREQRTHSPPWDPDQSWRVASFQPCPMRPDPYTQCRVSNSLQQSRDIWNPLSQNVSLLRLSSVCFPLRAWQFPCQPPFAPLPEHWHRYSQRLTSLPQDASYRARAVASQTRSMTSANQRPAGNQGNQTDVPSQ